MAEGAENETQMSLLRRMKCDTVQGYFVAKPLAWAAFKEFITHQPPAAHIVATSI